MYKSKKFKSSFSEALEKATGPIDYNMTNDYMFRAILQKNQKVLKGLICSLLHLEPGKIKSISIENPIELGVAIDDKSFVLDINVLLNDDVRINLEMQIIDELNWTDRSLVYLCRSFDQLKKGEEYSEIKPAIHIGFLCFTPFKECPEFYATYKLMNVKSHHVYSDKFVLSVVDLNHIELATEEDKQYEIDYWASLFKAKTWEELKMIAKNNEFMKEATETLYEMNADQIIRQQCLARQDYYRTQNVYKKRQEELEKAYREVTEEKKTLLKELNDKDKEINDKNKEINDKNKELNDKNQKILELEARLKAYENKI